MPQFSCFIPHFLTQNYHFSFSAAPSFFHSFIFSFLKHTPSGWLSRFIGLKGVASREITQIPQILQIWMILNRFVRFLARRALPSHASRGVPSVSSVLSVWAFFFLTDFTDSTDFCLPPFVIYHLAPRHARRSIRVIRAIRVSFFISHGFHRFLSFFFNPVPQFGTTSP